MSKAVRAAIALAVNDRLGWCPVIRDDDVLSVKVLSGGTRIEVEYYDVDQDENDYIGIDAAPVLTALLNDALGVD